MSPNHETVTDVREKQNSNTKLINMKKVLLIPVLAIGAMAASAQVVEQPGFFDNITIGINGGITSPLKHNPFFKSMRPIVGLNVGKQVTPAFAVGIESQFGINTSSWNKRVHSSTAFDDSYVGAYGKVDLFNLLGGYNCGIRPFTIEATAGAGWGHDYMDNGQGGNRQDWNYFATKAGLNFRFNVSDRMSIDIQPSVMWNMNGGEWNQTATAYSKNAATFNMTAGISYRFGDGFECIRPYDQAEIDALNDQINDLRGSLADANARAYAADSRASALASQLNDCRNKAPQVVKEVTNNLSSVRYVFFRIGSAAITADQQPNIEMIAAYLNNHPGSKVIIKGYASKDGNHDFNVKLAEKRAEAVKSSLMKKFKIPSSRIVSEGQGIGEMFDEQSWNRVSICTIEVND